LINGRLRLLALESAQCWTAMSIEEENAADGQPTVMRRCGEPKNNVDNYLKNKVGMDNILQSMSFPINLINRMGQESL
jgi:hypothetical protein